MQNPSTTTANIFAQEITIKALISKVKEEGNKAINFISGTTDVSCYALFNPPVLATN